MKLLSVYDLGQFNDNRREWRRGERRGLWRRRRGGTAIANQAGQDWEADQSKRMDQSKRTGNNILCGFTIPSSCPICDILQVLFHTTFIPFVCPESCCSLLFHLLTHPFGKNIYWELSVFSLSLSEFLWFLLQVQII